MSLDANKPAYSANAISARLRELYDGEPTLVVEGITDLEFWNGVKSQNVVLIPAEHKVAVIDGVRAAEGTEGTVVGVYDDDYDQLVQDNEYPIGDNLFSTREPNDIESLLFESWITGGDNQIYVDLYFGITNHVPKELVINARRIARKVGILRAKNRLDGWRLRFKGKESIPSWLKEFVKHHDGSDWEAALIRGIMDNSDSKVKPEVVRKGYSQARKALSSHPDSSLINGHDLSKIIQLLCDGLVKWGDIERWLRGTVKPHASEFELFKDLQSWSTEKQIDLIDLRRFN